MQRLSAAGVAIILALAGMTACGGDKEPAGPEADLVGTWIFEGTDLVEVLAGRFVEYAVEQGMSPEEAEAIVDEAFASAGEGFQSWRSTLRFNGDRTWKDDRGQRGTWRIEDGVLVSTDGDGIVERWEYILMNDDLTLILTKESLLSLSRQMDDSDARKAGYEFYSGLLADDDVLRFFYRRKS